METSDANYFTLSNICLEQCLPLTSIPTNLRIKIEALKCVDNIWKLCEIIVYQPVQAKQEGVSIDDGLVI